MTPFRKLTSAETAALEALGNSAEDWSKVLVSEDFKPFQLLQSHLEGDVEIAAEARIVRSRVANYRIGTGSLVEGVTALECRRRSAFGNGVGVATMNDCGGRTFKIFDRLSAQVAYVMAVYRHRPQTIAALEKMVDAYAEERSSEIGEVGSDCRIVGARFIREVRIGNGVEIDGASLLENATLCDGARVGVDVKAYDLIAAEGSVIDNGSIVERCFVGESCRLDKAFTAAASLFFALRPGMILTCVGKFLYPCFLVFLAILVVVALLSPSAAIADVEPLGDYASQPFFAGFLEGYNTMDALASLAFGIIVVQVIRDLGVDAPTAVAGSTVRAGIFSSLLMAFIYIAVTIAGTQSRGVLEASENGGTALAQIAQHYLGSAGLFILAATGTLACL